MRLHSTVLFAVLVSHGAVAQTTLGALLDAGAKPVSVAQFKEEVVQRVIVGPSPSGTYVEIMYAANGQLSGEGQMRTRSAPPGHLWGQWDVDHEGRVCSAFNVRSTTIEPAIVLPRRCQYWFKLGDAYYFADSDTDRSAKVLKRTIKK